MTEGTRGAPVCKGAEEVGVEWWLGTGDIGRIRAGSSEGAELRIVETGRGGGGRGGTAGTVTGGTLMLPSVTGISAAPDKDAERLGRTRLLPCPCPGADDGSCSIGNAWLDAALSSSKLLFKTFCNVERRKCNQPLASKSM